MSGAFPTIKHDTEAVRRAMGAESVPALTFDAFRAANVARCMKWHPQGIESWSPSDWLTAVTGELGELASLLKMRNRERDGLPGNKFSPTQRQIADELADVLTYLDLLAEVLGVDLGRAAAVKFNEVSERVGFPDRIPVPSGVQASGGFSDADRVNWLEKRLREDKANGFKWSSWTYETDKPIREQLDTSMRGDGVPVSPASSVTDEQLHHIWTHEAGAGVSWKDMLSIRDAICRVAASGVPASDAGQPRNWQDTKQGKKLQAAAARQLGLAAYTDEELAAEALRRINTSGISGALDADKLRALLADQSGVSASGGATFRGKAP